MHGQSITRSNLRKVRRHGFRARMKSRFGRKVLSKRRAIGRRLLPKI